MSDPDRPFEAAAPSPPEDAGANPVHADATSARASAEAPPSAFVPRVHSRTLATVLGACALVLAVVVWIDGRRAQRDFREEVAQRLSGIEAAASSTAKSEVALAGELHDAQAKVNRLEAELAESQSQQAALEALYRDLAPSRDEIAVSEIEQLLLVANQQLQLAGNVPSALTALQLADLKLRPLDRPQFLPLRRALANDIDALRAVPFVDVAGLSLKLDQAMLLAPSLPLAIDERVPQAAAGRPVAPSPEVPAWRRLLDEAWAQLSDLIRIENTDRPAAALLPPSQQYFVRENLKLRLLGARIALQNHDDGSFRSDVAAAEALLKQYFDVRAKSVQSVQATLKLLAATPPASAMPTLARSLEAARSLRAAQERGPARAAAPAAR